MENITKNQIITILDATGYHDNRCRVLSAKPRVDELTGETYIVCRSVGTTETFKVFEKEIWVSPNT